MRCFETAREGEPRVFFFLHSFVSGRDGYLYVFKLDTIRNVIRNNNVLDRNTCKEYRIENSKGATYQVIGNSTDFLQMLAVTASSYGGLGKVHSYGLCLRFNWSTAVS